MDQKNDRSQKSYKSKKITFFMPVNHAKEFFKSLHPGALYLQLFAQALNFYFRVLVSFSKKIFSQNSFQIVSTINGFADGKIQKP